MTFLFFLGLVTMIGVELNSVLYPEEVEPRRNKISAASKMFDEQRQRAGGQPKPSPNAPQGPVQRGVKGRTAVLLAVGASIVGVLLGRRSANSD
jgi:hypothetical protein